jgi:hypothetical protein
MSPTNHSEGQLGVENCTFNLHVQCGSSVTHPYFMLHCNVQHDGYTVLPSVTALLAAPGILLAGPRERAHAPGQAGRRDRERACGRLGHRRMHEGKQHGEGQTPSKEAGELGPTMRVVRQSRARRGRHSDLPGQGAGHVPCRVSIQVPRRHVAASGAVVTTACAPSHDAGHQPYAGISSWEVLRANNASTTTYVHGATMSIPT